MVELKKWNFMVGAVGLPGSGKSYRLATRIAEEYDATGALCVGHDPTWSYWEDDYQAIWRGRGGVHRHRSVADCVTALRRDSRGMHLIDVEDGAEVLKLGTDIGARSIAIAEQQKTNRYRPCIVLLDEAVGAQGVESHRLARDWKEAILTRRHIGIGIGWTGQSCYTAHKMMLTMASEMFVHRLVDPEDLKRLRAIGLQREHVLHVPSLPDRHALMVKSNRPHAYYKENEVYALKSFAPSIDGLTGEDTGERQLRLVK